jgi:hypothetical protein
MKDLKHKSNAAKQKEIFEQIRYKVQKSLRWNDLEYCSFQEQTGREYIQKMDERLLTELAGNRMFWKWWVNQWNRRDLKAISNQQNEPELVITDEGVKLIYSESDIVTLDRYKCIHSLENLIDSRWLHESFYHIVSLCARVQRKASKSAKKPSKK